MEVSVPISALPLKCAWNFPWFFEVFNNRRSVRRCEVAFYLLLTSALFSQLPQESTTEPVFNTPNSIFHISQVLCFFTIRDFHIPKTGGQVCLPRCYWCATAINLPNWVQLAKALCEECLRKQMKNWLPSFRMAHFPFKTAEPR